MDRANKSGGRADADPLDDLLEQVAQLTPVAHPTTIRPLRELCDGRFKIVRRVGGGGMGVVYEAFDQRRAAPVALKTLYHLDAQGIYRLKNEFRALSDVIHPNLVRLYELFVDDEVWFFTMELVTGERFDRFVRASQGPGLEANLRTALAQLAAGVQRIHAAGKLHRDLKPSNVLVRPNGEVVILDFGLIADSEPGGAGQTLTEDHASGTPAYMAPEQAGNLASSPASDWYAVGVMAFEALTGQLPFLGTALSVMTRKQLEDAPRVSSLFAEVSPELDALCAALLARNPADRPDGQQIAALTASANSYFRPGVARSAPEGREAELSVLRAAFTEAASGRAVLLRVSGESGLGKTTLVTHFLEELRARPDVVVLSGRCYEREALPYNALDRLVDDLTRYLRHLPEVDAAVLLPRNVAVLARIFPVLARIESVRSAPLPTSGEGNELRRSAFVACADLLGHIRDRRSLVLHIDDLQWLDLDSLLLLEHLLGMAEPIPMLLVTTHRDVPTALLARLIKTAEANRRLVTRELALRPLAPDATKRLASRLLMGLEEAAELVEVISRESRGSPFFVAELARYAQEVGATVRSGISFERVLSARLEKLTETTRDLLHLLAVSGRPTPVEVLARVLSAQDLQPALDVLRAAQLVRDAPQQQCECYHDRVREALRTRISSTVERDIHARLAQAWQVQPGADPEVLFEHCQAASMRERAGAYAVEAARKADRNLAFERSAELFGSALSLLPAAELERLNVRELHARALSLSGHWQEAAFAFDAAAAQRAPESAEYGQLRRQAALHYLGSGQSNQGLPRLRGVLAAAGVWWPRTRFFALLAAVFYLVWTWLRTARRSSASLENRATDAAHLDQLLVAASLLPPHDAVRGLYFMTRFCSLGLSKGAEGHVTVALGMLSALFMGVAWWRPRARALAAEVRMRVVPEANEPALASGALSFAAFTYFADGRAHDALELTRRAQELLADTGRAHVYSAWIARTLRAYGLLLVGKVAEAAVAFDQNAQLAKETGDTMSMLGADSPLRYLIRDDLAGARELLARKLSVLEHIPQGGLIHQGVTVERLLCALYEGRGDEALRELTKSARGAPMFFDTAVLVACCALQARDAGFTRRVVRRSLRQLKRMPDGAAKQAHLAQFQAALSHLDGDAAATLSQLALAERCYKRADMTLHAGLMRMRSSQLTPSPECDRAVEEAERALSELGIARPQAWLRMFASGFERVRADHVVKPSSA